MRRRAFLRAATGGLAAGGLVGAATPVSAGRYTDEYHDGYHYTRYVPSGASGGEPLLVALHGCSQEPDGFAAATRFNDLAEREGFVVVYPDQSAFANPYDCWNWFYDYHTTSRGTGEGGVVTDIARHERDRLSLDPDRVYLAGFSAGAAMVPNLLATYADVYAAGGVHSGLEYDAADTATGGTWAMSYGGPDPWYQGEQASEAMAGYGVADDVPTVCVHGTADDTVAPVNGDQVTVQAVETNDLGTDGRDDGNVDVPADQDDSGTTGGYDWRRRRFADDAGRVLVEYWAVEGMGHAWAGGAADRAYTAPDAPDATRIVWDFLARHSG
jgi:poly(hydroxyalkanoate) depolymerase family esterase